MRENIPSTRKISTRFLLKILLFFQWRIYRVIKGQEEITGHGIREMPIWGTQFKIAIQEESAETRAFRAAGRILVQVEYLRSLQAP